MCLLLLAYIAAACLFHRLYNLTRCVTYLYCQSPLLPLYASVITHDSAVDVRLCHHLYNFPAHLCLCHMRLLLVIFAATVCLCHHKHPRFLASVAVCASATAYIVFLGCLCPYHVLLLPLDFAAATRICHLTHPPLFASATTVTSNIVQFCRTPPPLPRAPFAACFCCLWHCIYLWMLASVATVQHLCHSKEVKNLLPKC